MRKVVIIVALLSIQSIVAAKMVWESEVVSSEPGMWEASLAIDSNDNPHISYRLYWVDNGGLQYNKMLYSKKTQQGWGSTAYDFDGGAYESLAIDSQGGVHISYCDLPDENLAYIYYNGNSWEKQIIDNNASSGGFTSLVLDQQGNPNISYLDLTRPNNGLRYAHNDGANWQIEEFPDWIGRTAIALDESGNPHIVAAGKYGHWNGSSWEFSTFASDQDDAIEASIEIDTSGNPHIAYSGNGVKYAHFNGHSWQIQRVGYGFSKVSLELDSNDVPHVMYGNCHHATLVDGNWVSDDFLAVGYFEDFVLDSQDRIHFVYTPNYESLIYVHQVPEIIIDVAIDIQPELCPNFINVDRSSLLPVAILGSQDYDTNSIDPASIRLAGVEPVRSTYEDIAGITSDPNDPNCREAGPDGRLDLVLKFETKKIVDAIYEIQYGDIQTLTLTGILYSPMLFEKTIKGNDSLQFFGGYKPINKADINKDGLVNFADFTIFAQNWLN